MERTMADENETPRMTQREAQEALEKQVTQLKREVSTLKRKLTESAEETAEGVSGWYDSAAEGASRAAQALKTQAQSVTGAVRENPGTVSSAMLVGGLFGFVMGLFIGQVDARRSRR